MLVACSKRLTTHSPREGPSHSMWEVPGPVTRQKQGQNPDNVLDWAKAGRGLGSTSLHNSDSSERQGDLCLPFLALKQFRAGEMLAWGRGLSKAW